MPLDENGNFTRLYGATGWQDDRDNDTKILASRHDEDANDVADVLNAAFWADGRKTAAGNFKMGGYRVSGMGDGQQAQDAASVKQVQNFAFNYGKDVSAEANAVKVNLSPAVQSLPQGMLLFVKVANDNTGKTTLQVNNCAAKPVYLDDQEIGQGMLKAGQVYIFFYNSALEAFQLIPSGSLTGQSVPPFTMIMLDHLLQGDAAVGWELQGTRCYKNKYWEQYDQLVQEYADAVERTETVEGQEFSYKVNLTTMRRFYSKNDYDERFALCGDSGGYVLDEETYSFYLPKCNNYMRPAVDADNLEAYQQDTLLRLQGEMNWDFIGDPQSKGKFSGPFYPTGTKDDASRHIYIGATGSDAWNPSSVGYDTAKAGEKYAGEETAPKSRFVAVYYKLGSTYTEQTSKAVLAAEQYAREAAEAVDGIDASVQTAQTAAAQAQQSAQEAQSYSAGALGLLTNKGVVTFWRGTLEEYQALESKDPDTLYLVEE